MTRTIKERAQAAASQAHRRKDAIAAELRALVEEIVDHCRPYEHLSEEIRRRFLGSPSAEEVVRKVWMDAESPAEIVSALRSAGLLREEAR